MTRATTATIVRHPITRTAAFATVMAWVDVTWPRVTKWWNVQTTQTKLALAVAALFVVVSTFNLATVGIGRALAPHVSAPVLASESAPGDATKTWALMKVWQGSGGRETESFSAGAHWRVDWLYSPAKAGDTLQIFIYAADGRLLMEVAADTQKGGADTTFWTGPGTFFLKVSSSGGDWKVDVQDLR